MVARYILKDNISLTAIGAFAAVMGLAITVFTLYHLYLLYIGQTTNESFKYSSYKDAYADMKKAHLAYLESVKTGKRQPATVLEIDMPRPTPTVSTVGTSNKHRNKIAGLSNAHGDDGMDAEEKSIAELIAAVDRCEDSTTDSLLAAESAYSAAQAAYAAVEAAHKWVCGGKSGGPAELQTALDHSAKAMQAALTARSKAQAAADAATVASTVLTMCSNDDGATGVSNGSHSGGKLLLRDDAQVGCVPSLAPRATKPSNTSTASSVPTVEDTDSVVAAPVSTPGASSGKGKARKGAKNATKSSKESRDSNSQVEAAERSVGAGGKVSPAKDEDVMTLKPQEGYPGMHIVRTLVERLDDIPDELATDPGELPASNIYRIGLFAELKRTIWPTSQARLSALKKNQKME
uniref:Uncharacterized protein n=2 Tax=Spumella elongata TaxID=89044 RepID=A0A7S3H6R2_9STRA